MACTSAGCAVTISGTTLNSHGAATWDLSLSGTDFLLAGAVFDNLPGASFATSRSNPYGNALNTNDGSTAAFVNQGSFASATDSFVRVGSPFANSGTVADQQGELDLGGTGSTVSSGSFTAAAGTTFDLNGQVLTASSSISSDGFVSIIDSTDAGSYSATAGTVADNTSFPGTVLAVGSSLEVGGAVSFAPTAGGPVTLTTGVITIDPNSNLTGTDSFVSDDYLWLDSFTTLSTTGSVDAYGGLYLGGSAVTISGTTLNNHGAATWDLSLNGTDFLLAGAVFDNLPGASFATSGSNPYGNALNTNDGSTTAFVDQGNVTTSTSSSASVDVLFANTGSVDLQEGTLGLNNATNTGTMTVSSGCSLDVGSYTQTAGSTVLNGGTINGGALSINGGALTGTGTINASVTSGGQVIPGGTGAAGTAHDQRQLHPDRRRRPRYRHRRHDAPAASTISSPSRAPRRSAARSMSPLINGFQPVSGQHVPAL